ncbi:hypothetical protein B0H13DRAFT_1935049 [Mycena leptocephala]|nr:hypothetical protein B0H13DRAFT_1935049 [Mycena leptocephala]
MQGDICMNGIDVPTKCGSTALNAEVNEDGEYVKRAFSDWVRSFYRSPVCTDRDIETGGIQSFGIQGGMQRGDQDLGRVWMESDGAPTMNKQHEDDSPMSDTLTEQRHETNIPSHWYLSSIMSYWQHGAREVTNRACERERGRASRRSSAKMFRKSNGASRTYEDQLYVLADPNRLWGHRAKSDGGEAGRSWEFPGDIYRSAVGSVRFKATYLVKTQQTLRQRIWAKNRRLGNDDTSAAPCAESSLKVCTGEWAPVESERSKSERADDAESLPTRNHFPRHSQVAGRTNAAGQTLCRAWPIGDLENGPGSTCNYFDQVHFLKAKQACKDCKYGVNGREGLGDGSAKALNLSSGVREDEGRDERHRPKVYAGASWEELASSAVEGIDVAKGGQMAAVR